MSERDGNDENENEDYEWSKIRDNYIGFDRGIPN